MGNDRFYVLARELLDAIVVYAATACDEPVVLPECRHVSHRWPVLDTCDKLTTWFDRSDAVVEARCLTNLNVTLGVDVWGCVYMPDTNGDLIVAPSPDQQDSDARYLAVLGQTVFDGAFSHLSSAAGVSRLVSTSVESLENEGGCGGYRALFQVQLN